MNRDEYDFYELHETPDEPEKKPEKKKRNGLAKRIVMLILAGVLVGASAGLAFQGVNALFDSGSTSAEQTTVTDADSATESDADDTSEDSADESTATLQTSTASSDGTTDSQSLDVSDIASAAMPSIVSITNLSVSEVQNYYNMYGMGGQIEYEETESAGSGIIIGENDTELLIVTNYHVIEDATTLTVGFADGSAYEANVKGYDSDVDIAVIAVPLEDITEDTMSQISIITIGDSSSLKVGEQVVAIGNALGYGQSVTTGIVSALNRSLDDSDSTDESSESTSVTYIQTDAAINPGNSGGALLNMNGELIGINTAKLASTEVEGMGYAIPISQIESLLEGLMNQETKEKVDESEQGVLGISCTDVDSTVSEMYGVPEGVYISAVNEGSAAETAGLQEGYIITALDGTTVSTADELVSLLDYYAAGETVEVIAYVSDNGSYEAQTFTVTLDASSTSSSSSDDGTTSLMPDTETEGSLEDSMGGITGGQQGW